ncbi:MAG: hypothetical protein GEU75_04850 [Dehalococcoidia bacterium]|nr:hypothetical protein [Dehalococcoidia bacterium]
MIWHLAGGDFNLVSLLDVVTEQHPDGRKSLRIMIHYRFDGVDDGFSDTRVGITAGRSGLRVGRVQRTRAARHEPVTSNNSGMKELADIDVKSFGQSLNIDD